MHEYIRARILNESTENGWLKIAIIYSKAKPVCTT